MNAPNLQVSLRAFNRRRPLKPYHIEFVTGDRLLITHPESVRSRGDLVVYMSPQESYQLFDSVSVCRLLDVPAEPVRAE